MFGDFHGVPSFSYHGLSSLHEEREREKKNVL